MLGNKVSVTIKVRKRPLSSLYRMVYSGQKPGAITTVVLVALGFLLLPLFYLWMIYNKIPLFKPHVSSEAKFFTTFLALAGWVMITGSLLTGGARLWGELTKDFPHKPDSVEPITYGQTVRGVIERANHYEVWEFPGKAGDIVRATVEIDLTLSDQIKPEISISLGSNGEYLDQNFCSWDQCELYDFELPSTGGYVLVVGRGDSGGKLAYNLNLIKSLE